MSTAQERAAERRRENAIHSIAYALCDHDEHGDGDYGNDNLADLIHAQLVADGHIVDDDTARLVAELRELVEHFHATNADDPCRLDHHGYCQEHSGGFRVVEAPGYRNGEWVDERPECWQVAASRVLADSATDRPQDSPTPPETPSEGTPVPPEPSEGDTGAVSGGAG